MFPEIDVQRRIESEIEVEQASVLESSWKKQNKEIVQKYPQDC